MVTPTEARAYLRAQSSVAPVLEVGGKSINFLETTGANGEIVATFDASLYSEQGDLSLKVSTDPVVTNNDREYSGSVTFQFTLPQ